jgi:hypothetical protein
VLIPWDYQFVPFPPPVVPDCQPLRQICPEGSVCTLTTTATVTDADEHVAWGLSVSAVFTTRKFGDINDRAGGGAYPNVVSQSAAGIGFCESPSYKAWFQGSWDACPVSQSQAVLGGPAYSFTDCTVIYYGRAEPTLRGPDDQRRIDCHASFKVQPDAALKLLVNGVNGLVVVPGPGLLNLVAAAGPMHAVESTKGRQRGTPSIAPMRIRVTKAGPVTIRLKLSGGALKALRRRHALTVVLKLTFIPVHGQRTVKTERVTLRLPACVRAAGRSSASQRAAQKRLRARGTPSAQCVRRA